MHELKHKPGVEAVLSRLLRLTSWLKKNFKFLNRFLHDLFFPSSSATAEATSIRCITVPGSLASSWCWSCASLSSDWMLFLSTSIPSCSVQEVMAGAFPDNCPGLGSRYWNKSIQLWRSNILSEITFKIAGSFKKKQDSISYSMHHHPVILLGQGPGLREVWTRIIWKWLKKDILISIYQHLKLQIQDPE